MELRDIEKFFNENFFKKIPAPAASEKLSDSSKIESEGVDFLHGVPESAYEPSYVENTPFEVSSLELNNVGFIVVFFKF